MREIVKVTHKETGESITARVSNILNYTQDSAKTAVLANWRKKFDTPEGYEGYHDHDEFMKFTTDLGTHFHSLTEEALAGTPLEVKTGDQKAIGLAEKLCEGLVNHDLWWEYTDEDSKVTQELPVVYKGLYCGTIDVILGSHTGLRSLEDWKTTRKRKTGYWEDNLLQLMFYTKAFEYERERVVDFIRVNRVTWYRNKPTVISVRVGRRSTQWKELEMMWEDAMGLFFTDHTNPITLLTDSYN